MCGIIGLYLKNAELRPALGTLFSNMFAGVDDRGPDSAGFAVYRNGGSPGSQKVTACAATADFDWEAVRDALAAALAAQVQVEVLSSHAVFTIDADTDSGEVRAWLRRECPDVRIVGYGGSIEVFKDIGRADDVTREFGLAAMHGTHAIGHTRMATESAVTTAHSHPFIAGRDICLVHNGSLSNHNRLRVRLARRGHQFETDNDTEVAAAYFAFRLEEGASLRNAMEAGLRELDGFYTFVVGTRDGFAVLRDSFACKPAVLAETEDWVAVASEFRSLASLPEIEHANIWEPGPGVVYAWENGAVA